VEDLEFVFGDSLVVGFKLGMIGALGPVIVGGKATKQSPVRKETPMAEDGNQAEGLDDTLKREAKEFARTLVKQITGHDSKTSKQANGFCRFKPGAETLTTADGRILQKHGAYCDWGHTEKWCRVG
jgi:hypothetical protein